MIEEQTKSYSKKQIFKTLHPWVQEWFDSQFEDFTPAQKKSIVEIHKKNNILISSPTGSGKTLTAFLSVISELTELAQKDELEDKVYCIYISPLKETIFVCKQFPINKCNVVTEFIFDGFEYEIDYIIILTFRFTHHFKTIKSGLLFPC